MCIYTYIYIYKIHKVAFTIEVYHTWGDPADIGQVWASTNAPQVEGCEGPSCDVGAWSDGRGGRFLEG